MKDWVEQHIWRFSLILTIIFAPLIIWGSWDLIGEVQPIALRIAIFAGELAVTYIGLGLLLMWNRYTQRKYREKGIIK
ncbi:hypothetical protein [Actinobaculum suis]|uniref:hypothetical protein n=1 Tax=Actinobaculum suis TaxID=1657 RepID=UPI0008088156|nr:hypothetical protein [Actinobaculum suis]OCA93904.1 hypothetical protein ACU21_08880 [Actinobaculum suis]OCA94828.1 hypothetical protein ACU20_05500 [Actinobaculum suis]